MRILSSQDDPESSKPTRTQAGGATQSAPTWRRYFRLCGELLPGFLIIVLPMSVHAGMFGSLVEILQQNVVVYEDAPVQTPAAEVELLSATTNVDPIGAMGGGDLIIDDGVLVSSGTLGGDELSAAKTFTGEISVYVVREGDTLSQIAEMYDVTTNTIRWANDIPGGVIQPGDTLVILPIAGVRHLIKSGDTLNSIAKKYDADTNEILDYNGLASAADLTVGETLVVPGGEIATPVRVASSPVRTSSGGGSTNFVHPVPGAIRTQGIHGYNAVDLASSYGTPIRAAAAGEVIVSKKGGWNGGYGSYIVVRHPGGVQTLYAHLSDTYVGVGAYVGAGEVIGAMGSTGRSTGTHLHFEVRGARNPF